MADYETLHMYVRYLTANNVSNFGGDPVTQLHFITIFNVMSPYWNFIYLFDRQLHNIGEIISKNV